MYLFILYYTQKYYFKKLMQTFMTWDKLLKHFKAKPEYKMLIKNVEKEYNSSNCFPEFTNIFKALELTTPDNLKVIIIGQDPYHKAGQAMGLSFSIPNGNKMQPSLRNIFKELKDDIDIVRHQTDLSDWAKQGVLLLNTSLTVRENEPNTHKDIGWEIYTSEVIKRISSYKRNIVFILWGNHAQEYEKYIQDANNHFVIKSSHPSPFSAHKSFLGSKPFSKTNSFLISKNIKTINW